MHDYIIGVLIIIIVAIQFLVAITTSKKITLFKNVVPNINSFETVKVFIREEQIKTITAEEILANINHYKGQDGSYDIEIEKVENNIEHKFNEAAIIDDEKSTIDIESKISEDDGLINPIIEKIKSYLSDDNDQLISISKGDKEKKIPLSQLSNFRSIGWIITEDKN